MSRTYGKAQDLIDYTRASSGTALRRVKYGVELVTNGTFDTDSDWTKGVGWSISGGVAVSSGSNNYGGLQQTASLTAGKVYSVTFTISSYTSGSLKFAIGSTTGNLYSSVGTFTENFVYIEPHVSGKNVSIFPWGAFVGTIDNVSVKEVTFDTSDGDLILFNHPNNIPRIEYDANGNLLGLLVEESRANKITYSEDFSNSYWQKTDVTLSAASVKAPDGSYTATKVAVSGGNPHMVRQSVASSGDCKSIWARTVSGTGTVALLALFASGDKIVTLTEEWQRFDILYDDETGAVPDFFYAVDFRGSSTLTEAIIWGAQVEAGSFPTSYIPTSGSTATRSADVASLSTSAFGYRQDEGTLALKATPYDASSLVWFAAFGSLASDSIQFYTSASKVRTFIRDGGVDQAAFNTIDSISDNTEFSFASGFKQNDVSSVVDGGTIASDTSASIPNISAVLNIGVSTNGANQLNGHIKSIKYLPRRLTNAQLQELTS